MGPPCVRKTIAVCPAVVLSLRETVFGALKDIEFDGCILLETYNSSIDNFAYQRGMFHDVCPDGREFTRKGFAFVRKHLSSKIGYPSFQGVSRETGGFLKQPDFLHERIKILFSQKKEFLR